MKRNENNKRSFPDTILIEDFFAALDPSGQTKEIAENLNSLTACLEQRCEWIFDRFPDRNAAWEEVFRSLAFKEPNNGTYTKRRASMTALCKSPVIAVSNNEELNRLLLPWLGPHQYLFWDESSHTIKVTHESLIRRWKRFRDWADLDDRQFHEYLQILEDCTRWLENGKKEKDLTEGVALRRAEDNKLVEALNNETIRKRFNNLLRMHRDQSRLNRGVESALEFLNQSFDKRQHKSRMKKLIFLIAPLALMAFCLGIYLWIGTLIDEQQRTFLRSYGMAAETQFVLPSDGSVDQLEEVQLPLGNMLAAISLQNKEENKPPVSFLTSLYRTKLDAVHKFDLLSGSRTISGLRRVLLGNAWRHEPDAKNLSKVVKTAPQECQVQSISQDVKNNIDIKDKKVEFYTSTERDGYGLIALLDRRDLNSQVFWGKREGKKCFTNIQQLVYWSTPGSKLGFDANQRYLVDSSNGRISITSIDWPVDGEPESGKPLPTSTRLIYNNPTDTEDTEFLQLDGTELHVSLPTITGEFTQDIQVGKDWLRLFDSYPAPTSIEPEFPDEAHNDEGICKDWKSIVDTQSDSLAVWGQKTASEFFCLIISNSRDKAGTYFGDLYLVRDNGILHLKDQSLLPIISRIALGRNLPSQIRIDLKNGHILSKSGEFWLKQPWSANAWINLAKGVFNEEYYREALKNNVKGSRYLRAKSLFQDEADPDNWQQLVEKTIHPIPIQLAKTSAVKERI